MPLLTGKHEQIRTNQHMNKQVILVTGASSGMGKETARTLIKQGHIVYGAARRVDKMQDLVQAGGHALAMDVTDEAGVKDAVDRIVREQGRIDVLVNNAGYAVYGAVEDVTLEEARRQFDVNIFGLAQVTKAVLPHMRDRRSGKIINISSMGGKMYTPLGAWYHASKHALEGWSDCLRLELAPFGIQVVVVEPGGIETEFGQVAFEPMLKRAQGSVYEPMTRKLVEGLDKVGQLSPPSVIANEIAKAVHAKRPRTRYRKGKFAKPMVWLRTYLGDRAFDRIVMSQVK